MRKNTARHWLHAGLDLLPLILIPVFMIYSHRHDLSTDITIQQDVYKDFYQEVKNGKPSSLEFINFNGTEDVRLTDSGYLAVVTEDVPIQFDVGFTQVLTNDKFYFSFVAYGDDDYYFTSGLYYNDDGDWFNGNGIYLTSTPTYYSFIQDNGYGEDINDTLSIAFYMGNGYEFYVKDVQIFNLTEIFGSGNEPTKDVFESYLTQDYYDFGSNQVLIGTIDVPAKNNDIMSVFMDSFNNSIDKYFNMGNVFGMTNVYQWFNTNIFGGNAPTIIFSVWNIVLYEFVMDLLFLLYALFMWFIDVTKRLIEKPLDSIK